MTRIAQTIIPTVFLLIGIAFLSESCQKKTTKLFKLLPAAKTNIVFNNQITENDTINPIDLEFIYNGGGVAAADFNLDGFQDIYFTGSISPNKLYLNNGNFTFKDVTHVSASGAEGRWCNGASIADVNQDGLPDIYLSTTIYKEPSRRTNILYIHQGFTKDSVPIFKDMAAEYGLADTTYSVQAAFFDYDRDGDLDMYLLTTKPIQRDVAELTPAFNQNNADSSSYGIDRLYRNDWNDSLKHPVYTNVSQTAGINRKGYGLGIVIADVNTDGWKDIYIANDFYGNDLLYINQQNGTFAEQLSKHIKHTSMNAMGTDAGDINNDGLPDLVTVDMNPADNYRKKKNMNGSNYFLYQNFKMGGYMYQYVRNTLQLNMGNKPGTNDAVFSEAGYMAGIAATDWSWNPTFADFDNDGLTDLLITNGYPRDVTDHDFGMFKASNAARVSKKELIDQIPIVKIPNYGFKNTNGLLFKDVSKEWGLDIPSFSYGAVPVDLDNDGDLDYVVNNINDEAFVFENTLQQKNKNNQNFIKIKFKGTEKNRNGIGAKVTLYANGKLLMQENNPCRGYLSSVSDELFFGLGNISTFDSAYVEWPDGLHQKVSDLKINQKNTISYNVTTIQAKAENKNTTLFTPSPAQYKINFKHIEADHIDFNLQRLLPHKLSQYGPPLAIGDINNDGTDDVIIGGNGDFEAAIFIQQPNGKFLQSKLPHDTGSNARRPEHTSLLLFDADNDGDKDLYAGCGSNEWAANTPNYQDKLYINNGKGQFVLATNVLPQNYNSTGCVRACDYDADGDLDLFVASRQIPGKYPMPAPSFILKNESNKNEIKFTDATPTAAPFLKEAGMVCDMLWTDFNNDGQFDIILAGEWMPVTFLQQKNGKFENINSKTGIEQHVGWWNSLAPADIDNDGDIDYVAGNLGLNSYYSASPQYPAKIYGADIDKNGMFDIFPTLFLSSPNGTLKEYPAQVRDEVTEQNPSLKKKYLSYKSFGEATIQDILPQKKEGPFISYAATSFSHMLIKNNGNGNFSMEPLPLPSQTAPMFGCILTDINQDGFDDIVAVGNDYGTEVSIGHYDASNGWVLAGTGKGTFSSITMQQSGFFVPGNAKALALLKLANGNMQLVATQNQDSVLQFHLNRANETWLTYSDKHVAVIFHFKNGQQKKAECYSSQGFASQSSAIIQLPLAAESVTIIFSNRKSKRLSREELKQMGYKLPNY
jgi:hypothetical protein